MIITPTEISTLARPCYADVAVAEQAIKEVEMFDIKANIGDELYIDITRNPANYTVLLNGGTYIDRCGKTHLFGGLKKTAAYYALGRIIRTGSNTQTRFGFVKKSDDYSEQTSVKERTDAANEVFSIADQLLSECLQYIEQFHCDRKEIVNNRTTFRIIGK